MWSKAHRCQPWTPDVRGEPKKNLGSDPWAEGPCQRHPKDPHHPPVQPDPYGKARWLPMAVPPVASMDDGSGRTRWRRDVRQRKRGDSHGSLRSSEKGSPEGIVRSKGIAHGIERDGRPEPVHPPRVQTPGKTRTNRNASRFVPRSIAPFSPFEGIDLNRRCGAERYVQQCCEGAKFYELIRRFPYKLSHNTDVRGREEPEEKTTHAIYRGLERMDPGPTPWMRRIPTTQHADSTFATGGTRPKGPSCIRRGSCIRLPRHETPS